MTIRSVWAFVFGSIVVSSVAHGSDRDHWAFQPIVRPDVPDVSRVDWPVNSIDRFVLHRLEEQGWQPSPVASRRVLVRRLYLDLVGLPPSPEQVERFVNDPSPDAYERLVDSLLASPHYGERWGRRWLDLARYADSHGYDMDQPRPHAWRYRHWVIHSLNVDMPFDQFSIEQLAGDLLPKATVEQQVATGFHRNAPRNTEFGADEEEDRVRRTVDRVNTVGATWLGLTLNCARCHDHRYDPLSIENYYGLYDFFSQMEGELMSAPLPVEASLYPKKKERFDGVYDPVARTRRLFEQRVIPSRCEEWEAGLGELPEAEWQILRPQAAYSIRGDQVAVLDDDSVLATGFTPNDTIYTVNAPLNGGTITGIRLEVLPHPSLPNGGPGRSPTGDFDLYQFSVQIGNANGYEPVRLMNPVASHEADARPVADALGEFDQKSGWSIGDRTNERHVAVFEFAQPVQVESGNAIHVTLGSGCTDWFQVVGRFRLAVTSTPTPFTVGEIVETAASVVAMSKESRSREQQELLNKYFRSRDPDWARLNQIALDVEQTAPTDPANTKARVVRRSTPRRATHVMLRGDFTQLGDEVEAHVPEFLPGLVSHEGQPSRLEFARWLFSAEHPLTARVQANRIWQYHFGRGLVITDDDFGLNGEPPTHPQLLDWLASELKDDWSVKRMHRLIVLSATYRQQSHLREGDWKRDRDNRWLSRQNRLRLDAEVIRDSMLSVSGRLDRRIGGPSVVLPQPSGADDLSFSRSRQLVTSYGADLNRRSVYVWAQRTAPYPMFGIFDGPSSSVCTTRRTRSKTPLQALLLLNDDEYFGYAVALAEQLQRNDESDWVESAFRICLGRRPTLAERRVFERDAKDSPVDASDRALAVVRILLNLEEFVVRE